MLAQIIAQLLDTKRHDFSGAAETPAEVQDAIRKMEEYNLGMKNAVQLWDATVVASQEPPGSNAHPVAGGCRPLTGSEARTVLAQCAPTALSFPLS
jgi:hypothetical protein